ncbi:unnamed protein product [Closterium sp. NIES-53]
MWQIPVLPWRKSGKAAAAASMEESVTEEEQQGVQGEELIGGSAAVKASATSGQTDWETWHRRLAHVAVSTLEVMHKEKCVHGLQLQRDGAHYGSCEAAVIPHHGGQMEPFHVGTSPVQEERCCSGDQGGLVADGGVASDAAGEGSEE